MLKNTLKKTLFLVAVILVAPLLLLFFIMRAVFGQGVFAAFSHFLSLFPGKLGSYFRVAFYRFTLTKCSPLTVIHFGTLFSQLDTEIEQGVYIGAQCNIGKSKIGCNTLIASGVHIMSGKGQHNFSDLVTPIQQQGGQFCKISIGEDCWIGNGALIMANIGKKSIVGAGSVVTKDVPDYSVVVGNPAKVVKSRLDESGE